MQDFSLAARSILRSPGFAVAGILSLALAIAANTIVFGALNALILRPLRVDDPERLFFLQREQSVSHAFPLYRTLRDRATLFDLTAWR
jgi:hypothetical protein